MKLYQVENKANDQQKSEKVPSIEFFLPAQFWKTALLSIIVAVLALLLSFVLSISLLTVVQEAIFDYYWAGIDTLKSVFQYEVSFEAEEFGVNWKDVLLLLHMQGGNLQVFLFGFPEDYSLLKNMFSVEYHLGLVGLLLIPFLCILMSVLLVKRWLPTNSYLLILFSGMTSFVYSLVLVIIAFMNEKTIEFSPEYGGPDIEILFHYNLFQVFTIPFIFLLLFTNFAVNFAFRRKSEHKKKEMKLDIVLAVINTLGFVFIGATIAIVIFAVIKGISSSDSSLKDVIFSPSGVVLTIPLAFYLMHLLFGGALRFTSADGGFIRYSIIDGYRYTDDYNLREINELFLFLTSSMGMKLMIYLLLFLPIGVLIRTGYQLAKYSSGHRLRNIFLYTLMIASILFLLAYVSKFGYIYVAHSDIRGLIATSERLEIEEGKIFLRSFLISLIFSVLGGVLYVMKQRGKQEGVE